MWKKYFTRPENVAKFSEIEEGLYRTLARVVEYHIECDFYFVPFNTDTFGMSDIDAAHRLKSLVGDSPNYVITYEEKHCESMVNYLKNFDLSICMRLHACVFCWSSGIPTLGIEYSDTPGKVSDFFDQHKAGYCFLASDVNFANVSKFLNEYSASA